MSAPRKRHYALKEDTRGFASTQQGGPDNSEPANSGSCSGTYCIHFRIPGKKSSNHLFRYGLYSVLFQNLKKKKKNQPVIIRCISVSPFPVTFSLLKGTPPHSSTEQRLILSSCNQRNTTLQTYFFNSRIHSRKYNALFVCVVFLLLLLLLLYNVWEDISCFLIALLFSLAISFWYGLICCLLVTLILCLRIWQKDLIQT